MVLEGLKSDLVERRPYVAFFYGVFAALVGYAAARIFFPLQSSVAMLFLSTLLIVPLLMKLLDNEELRERTFGISHFLSNHKDVLEYYLFLFLGLFAGYLTLGSITGEGFTNAFSFQDRVLSSQMSSRTIDDFFNNPLQPSLQQVSSILERNIPVTGILFILSFFYGAGAVFLIVLNASVFSSFILSLTRYLDQTAGKSALLLSFFAIHMIPEIFGFLLAAMAGGVISKALLTEKFMSGHFLNVLQDSLILLMGSVLLIILAAFLEVFVTSSLFHAYA